MTIYEEARTVPPLGATKVNECKTRDGKLKGRGLRHPRLKLGFGDFRNGFRKLSKS